MNGHLDDFSMSQGGEPITPGNNRRKAGKPSYETLISIICGNEAERNATKLRTYLPDVLAEWKAQGGDVRQNEDGSVTVLADRGEVVRAMGS